MRPLLERPAVAVFAEPVCVCVRACYQGSRRSDEEALEEQVRKLGEELRELRELYEAEQDKSRSGEDELLQLHNQVPTVTHTHTQGLPPAESIPLTPHTRPPPV